MRPFLSLVASVAVTAIFMSVKLAAPALVSAQASCLASNGINFTSPPPQEITAGQNLNFTLQNVPAGNYEVIITATNIFGQPVVDTFSVNQTVGSAEVSISDSRAIADPGLKTILLRSTSLNNTSNMCNLWSYTVQADDTSSCNISYTTSVDGQEYQNPSCVPIGNTISVSVTDLIIGSVPVNGVAVIELINTGNINGVARLTNFSNGAATTQFPAPSNAGLDYVIRVRDNSFTENIYCTLTPFNVQTACSEEDLEDEINSSADPYGVRSFELCENATDTETRSRCQSCLGNDGIYTALGCLPTSPRGFVEAFLRLAAGIAGGFALIRLIWGAFLLTTSAGNPKQIQNAQETVTSSIAGLLFIIFAVILLQLIGAEILQLPGL